MTSTPYTYMPIDEATHEIRILRLHPGKFTDPIRVSLIIESFAPDHVPVFEALSYVWGSPENPVNIFIGESKNKTLSITRNLGVALPYLRYEDKPRFLWIDAICVNQQDMQERSQQVKRMAEIFSRAERVVAWLGPALDTTAIAMDCFNTIASHIDVDWVAGEIRSLSDDKSWADLETPPGFSRKACLAMLDLFKFQWFERLWVVQEIQLASSEAILLCGYHVLKWASFRKAIWFLDAKTHLLSLSKDSFTSFCNQKMNIFRMIQDTGYMTLDVLVEQTKNFKCTDPRDRIFAILSLLSEDIRGCGIEPDYTKTVLDIFRDTVEKIMTNTTDWSVLGSIEMDEPEVRSPSWVPNWSVPRKSQVPQNFLASGRSKGMVDFSIKGVMQLQGRVLDTIQFEEQCNVPDTQSSQYYEEVALQLQKSIVHLRASPKFSDMDLSSMCRCLCAGRFSERYILPSEDIQSLAQIEVELARLLDGPNDAWVSSSRLLMFALAVFSFDRSLFRTSQGYFGLAPKTIQPGDVVAVLLGYQNPMILRPAYQHYFQVVGNAYCDGFMDSEALLGALPDGFVSVFNRREDGRLRYGFFNSKTKCWQPEDPRLAQVPLPPGWEVKRHEKEHLWTWFINKITGEDNGSFDPRLSPNALKQKGVDIRTFDLI